MLNLKKFLPHLLTQAFTRNKKVLVIVGPTASGKSGLAIEIAKQYNGEIISCDSRQIYSGLEIFSGAVTPETSGGVKHHLVSFFQLGKIYSADLFVKDSLSIIDTLHTENKLPIIAGGTGFWAQALMFEKTHPEVSPDYKFRETLEGYSAEDLYAMVQQKDPRRAAIADPHNKKRLIRALEIIEVLGKVPEQKIVTRKGYTFTLVYLKPEKALLNERITKNVSQRLEQGLLNEAKETLQGLSEIQCQELGLGYKHLFDLQNGKISPADFADQMTREEIKYAKRQKTFFNKLFKTYTGPKIVIEGIDREVRLASVKKYL